MLLEKFKSLKVCMKNISYEICFKCGELYEKRTKQNMPRILLNSGKSYKIGHIGASTRKTEKCQRNSENPRPRAKHDFT